MKTYTTEEARKNLGKLTADALAGNPSLITYYGVPVAMVVQAPRSITVADKDSATTTEIHKR